MDPKVQDLFFCLRVPSCRVLMARFFTLSALLVTDSVRPPALDTCAVGFDHERHAVGVLLTPDSVTCMHVKIMHVGRFMRVGSPFPSALHCSRQTCFTFS